MYQYKAVIVRVVDGDTLKVDIDLGFNAWLRDVSARVRGVNAPEISTAEGVAAQVFVKDLVAKHGTAVVLDTVKNDKYGGRYDAKVTLNGGLDLASELLSSGHAVPFMVGAADGSAAN